MGINAALANYYLRVQAHSAAMETEAKHRRFHLAKQGFDVIGARIDKATGRHTIIYRGETRIPAIRALAKTSTSEGEE